MTSAGRDGPRVSFPAGAIETGFSIEFASIASISLNMPENFREAFQQNMFGIMCSRPLACLLINGANSRRLVDADLSGDGEVQREVQERIDLTVPRHGFGIYGVFRIFRQNMIFRVAFDYGGRDGFSAFEKSAFSGFSPGFAKKWRTCSFRFPVCQSGFLCHRRHCP
jgi:hypothetical protein